MNFWNEEKLREALPYAQFFNFPPNWGGKGLYIWHEQAEDDGMILVRREKETRGVLPRTIDSIQDKVSAIIASDVTAYFKYRKPLIEVSANPQNVIIDLARYIRKNYNGKVIAVTGSSGKSTTTQLVYDILASKYNTSANLNKYNTSWGLSWNMTCFDIDSKYWVIETSLGGGMSRNSAITKPHYAIITNIAPVHLTEGMKLEDVAKIKAQIFNSMEEGSCAILYKEAAHFEILKNAAEYKGLKIITFGESEDCDIRIIADSTGKFIIDGQEYILKDTRTAKHILFDMAAALAVATEEGFEIEDILNVLRNFSQVEGRGNQINITLPPDKKVTLIDESYNANPLSMKAALEGFAHLYQDRNKVVILGDMAECGEESVKYHLAIAESIRLVNPKKVILCGKDIKHLYNAISSEFNSVYFETIEDLNSNIKDLLEDNDYAIVKSSHSSGLHKTVKLLKRAGI